MAKRDGAAGGGARFVEVRTIGERLSTTTDQLNDALELIEKHLAAARLGVYGELDITSAEEAVESTKVLLSFKKQGGSWRLYIITEYSEYSNTRSQETLLVRAAKHIRVRAASRLPELVDILLVEAKRQLAEVSEAV